MIPETEPPPRIRVIRHVASAREIGPVLADSIRAIEHAEAASTAIFLDDMPWISGDSLKHLLGESLPKRIVVPAFGGLRGARFAFKSHFWRALNLLIGDSDKNNLPQAHPHSVDLPELSSTGTTSAEAVSQFVSVASDVTASKAI